MRNYFSSHHLWAARMFADEAQALEKMHSGEKSKFDIRHRALINGTILSSVAFLESAINELYQDATDKKDLSYIEPLSKKAIGLLGAKWKEWFYGSRRIHKSILEKYNIAMECCGLKPFDKGKTPFQEVALVIKLRNTLVHFMPEDVCSDIPHELGDSLKSYFPENKMMKNSGNPFFPDKCLGAGCAFWAISSVVEFADAFFAQIKVMPNYQRVRFE